MAAHLTMKDAQTLYDMGLISDEEFKHYQAIAEWRKTLRAGANTTHEVAPFVAVGGTVANG
jgi:hypothetical protein